MTEAKIEGHPQSVDQLVDPDAKLPKLLEKDAIKANQDVIRTNLLNLDILIHQNAIQCVMHAEKHGDTSLMRRLLVDIIDDKSGYRRQGVIAWMKKFTPMELSGDVIKLNGLMPDGETKRPWRIEEANRTFFGTMAEAQERVGKPVYRETLMSKINLAMKEWRNAKANTTTDDGGKPIAIDKTKPFYNGLHMDAMDAFFNEVDQALVPLTSKPDQTLEVQKARDTAKRANAEVEALESIKVA